MASSRRTGTSEDVKTYGGSGLGRDYTVLATWEAATDIDCVTGTTSPVLECYDDEVFDDSVDINGATTNATYFRIIRPATGEGHDGTPNTGVRFVNVSDTTASSTFKIQENYFGLYDLVISTSRNIYCISIQGNYCKTVGAIGQATYDNYKAWFINTGLFNHIINCLCYGSKKVGFYNYDGYGYYYNCSAINCDKGFDDQANGYAKNCLADHCTIGFLGGWNGNTDYYNGSDTVFKDAGSDDYHLDSTDTTCRGNGADLSADAVYAFDDDIDGDTRSAWDIGVDEYVAAGFPDPVTSFVAAPGDYKNDLGWVNPVSFDGIKIMRLTTGYPTNTAEGTEVYDSTGESVEDSGLDANVVYYYTAWAYNENGLSGTAIASGSPGPVTYKDIMLRNSKMDKYYYMQSETDQNVLTESKIEKQNVLKSAI